MGCKSLQKRPTAQRVGPQPPEKAFWKPKHVPTPKEAHSEGDQQAGWRNDDLHMYEEHKVPTWFLLERFRETRNQRNAKNWLSAENVLSAHPTAVDDDC